ncbi:MAG: glycoside hydrolase family 6 protein, partial [Solirubrobacteraceae bacterium]
MSIISRRSTALALASLWLALVVPTAAQAATPHDGGSPGAVQLDQPAYIAHENQGYLTITIQRSGDLSGEEHVGYGVKRQDAQPGIDFDTIANHYVTFAPGQDTYTFNVRIIDQGMNATPVHALAYLYGSWPDSLGANNNAMITILHDDPLEARDPANPLGAPGPTDGNPLAGTKFYVDPTSGAATAQARYRNSKPAIAALLGNIASEPGAHRFYMWNMGANVSGQVSHYLEGTQVQQPGTTVMLSTYTLVHDHCGYTATPAIAARYEDFMHQMAEGIGNYHVVFFLELDSLITAPCLTQQQLAIRQAELRSAVSALEADPHVVVYLDAGAADAVHYGQMATWLRASGVAQAQGFFLNSTHFDWTSSEIHYGQQVSRRLGGTHFVVNTGSNGKGPLVPKRRVG